MACLERASPALKRILLKLYRENKAIEIDHHLYEFGSVEYHIQVLHKRSMQEEEKEEEEEGNHKVQANAGCMFMRKMINVSKPKVLKRRYNDLSGKIKRIRSRIKIQGFVRFRRRWLKMPKFSSSLGYTKLD